MSATLSGMLDDLVRGVSDAMFNVNVEPVPEPAGITAPVPQPPGVPSAGPMMRAAGIMFVDPDGAVLMLKRGPGSDYPGMWCFPGGTTEEGETAEQTAERECIEELGFMPKGRKFVLTRSVTGNVDYTTFMQSVPKKFIPEINGEHTAFMWAHPLKMNDGDPAVRMDDEDMQPLKIEDQDQSSD